MTIILPQFRLSRNFSKDAANWYTRDLPQPVDKHIKRSPSFSHV